MRVTRVASLCALAALAGGVGCGEEEGATASGPHKVRITNDGYDPSHLSIEVGDRVTFVNRTDEAESAMSGAVNGSPQPGFTRHDGSEINHGTRAGFATHALFPGEAQVVIFDVPRRYTYRSSLDDNMVGTIEVRPKDE